MRHIVVCNPAGSVLATVAGKRFVILGQFRVLGDDIPGVHQPWKVPEEEKSDVDHRVGTAETALDPDWEMTVSLFSSGAEAGEGMESYRRWEGTGWRPGRGICRRSTSRCGF